MPDVLAVGLSLLLLLVVLIAIFVVPSLLTWKLARYRHDQVQAESLSNWRNQFLLVLVGVILASLFLDPLYLLAGVVLLAVSSRWYRRNGQTDAGRAYLIASLVLGGYVTAVFGYGLYGLLAEA